MRRGRKEQRMEVGRARMEENEEPNGTREERRSENPEEGKRRRRRGQSLKVHGVNY